MSEITYCHIWLTVLHDTEFWIENHFLSEIHRYLSTVFCFQWCCWEVSSFLDPNFHMWFFFFSEAPGICSFSVILWGFAVMHCGVSPSHLFLWALSGSFKSGNVHPHSEKHSCIMSSIFFLLFCFFFFYYSWSVYSIFWVNSSILFFNLFNLYICHYIFIFKGLFPHSLILSPTLTELLCYARDCFRCWNMAQIPSLEDCII